MDEVGVEKAHHLRVEIDIADLPVHPPQERDSWLTSQTLL